MKRMLVSVILVLLVLTLVAQPVLATDCVCGGVTKYESWSFFGFKLYLSRTTLEWIGVVGGASGVSGVVGGLIALFAGGPAILAEVLMIAGVYLISGGGLAQMTLAMENNGIILYCTYFLPYPVYVTAQASCCTSSGGGGGGPALYLLV